MKRDNSKIEHRTADEADNDDELNVVWLEMQSNKQKTWYSLFTESGRTFQAFERFEPLHFDENGRISGRLAFFDHVDIFTDQFSFFLQQQFDLSMGDWRSERRFGVQ